MSVFMGYIYSITNNTNGRQYVGQTTARKAKHRWHSHKSKANSGAMYNELYVDMRVLGVKHFTFDVIEECKDFELNDREQHWIDKLDTLNNGYNLIPAYGRLYNNLSPTVSIKKEEELPPPCNTLDIESVLRKEIEMMDDLLLESINLPQSFSNNL